MSGQFTLGSSAKARAEEQFKKAIRDLDRSRGVLIYEHGLTLGELAKIAEEAEKKDEEMKAVVSH